jgi:hypothetical protein
MGGDLAAESICMSILIILFCQENLMVNCIFNIESSGFGKAINRVITEWATPLTPSENAMGIGIQIFS